MGSNPIPRILILWDIENILYLKAVRVYVIRATVLIWDGSFFVTIQGIR